MVRFANTSKFIKIFYFFIAGLALEADLLSVFEQISLAFHGRYNSEYIPQTWSDAFGGSHCIGFLAEDLLVDVERENPLNVVISHLHKVSNMNEPVFAG